MIKRPTQFDIRREGHAIAGGAETLLNVPRLEMTDGKLFNNEEDRLFVLGLLLESVGIDRALTLGNRELWREAVDALGKN